MSIAGVITPAEFFGAAAIQDKDEAKEAKNFAKGNHPPLAHNKNITP